MKAKLSHTPITLAFEDRSSDEIEQIKSFIADLNAHSMLQTRDAERFVDDFVKAIRFYLHQGLPLDQALERLKVSNLGGFYARPPILWFPLDDAAKVYPININHDQMTVFRLSVYLREEVVPELLQIALSFTIKRFPGFAVTVKRGFFWHYLDASKRRYYIEQDGALPCRALRIARSGSQSFRVLYYRNRISIEFFHALTDGTGGMVFLKTLTAEYLRLLGVGFVEGEGVLNVNQAPSDDEFTNEFLRANKKGKSSGFVDKPALQLSGKLSRRKPCRVLHFKFDATKLKELAKQQNSSVTAYVLAQLFLASKFATDDRRGALSVQMPVNMRKFYPSKTLRNFSLYCGIRLNLDEISDVPAMLAPIKAQIEEKASLEAMNAMMNATRGMVSSVRYLPLFLKEPIVRLVHFFLGDRLFSSTLSNLGLVQMPADLGSHIESMDFVLGPGLINRVQCALITFGNVATLSITKVTADPSFEEELFRLLSADGLEVQVEGSCLYEN